MRWMMTVIACLSTTLSLPAQPTPLPATKTAQLEATIADAVKQHNVPGLSAAVVFNKQLVWAKGFGKADLENDVPATEKTVYRLASVSKPLTAILAMKLVDQGKLDLDAPVQKYVPTFPEKDHPVLVRHLLCHQSGIRHYGRNGVRVTAELESTRHFTKLEDGLSMFQNDALLHIPGDKLSYTTHGYTLLGCIIEEAGGKPYLQQLQDVIATRAGASSLRDDDIRTLIPHRAQGYNRNQAGQIENSTLLDNSYKIPGGGLCCNAADLARVAAALMDDKLLSAKTREQLWARQKLNDGTETTMAYGWLVRTALGRRTVIHGGAQQRVSTMLHLEPDHGIAVVLLCNLERQNLAQLADKLAALLHDDP